MGTTAPAPVSGSHQLGPRRPGGQVGPDGERARLEREQVGDAAGQAPPDPVELGAPPPTEGTAPA